MKIRGEVLKYPTLRLSMHSVSLSPFGQGELLLTVELSVDC
jgi:hypothetical protein